MNNRLHLIILLICTLLLVQCRKDEIVTEIDPTPIEADAKNVSFLLHIVNEVGTPVEEASVTIVSTSESLTSDENGVVLFNLPSVAFEGEQIVIEHPTYNTLTKMVTGVMDSNTKVNVTLTEAVTKLIGTGETGSIGEGELTLPSTLRSPDGSSYTGPVAVKYTYLDPDNSNFLDAAPGNLLALNTANQYRQLASLGMYSIELYDEQGSALTIPEGSTATVKFPIAEANAGTVPDEVPLWYFDEDQSLWIEEGKAIVEGNMMVAQVSHFTWWNCDLPYEFVPLCMQFVDEDGEAASGVAIVFSVDGVQFGRAYTDDSGNILAKVPVGTVVIISYYINGELVGVQDIGTFTSRSEKPVIVLSYNASKISGTALDCDMNDLTASYGIIKINGVEKVFQIVDGAFSFRTAFAGSIEVIFYDVGNGKSKTQTVFVTDLGTDVVLGNVIVCDQSISSGIKGVVMIDADEDGVVDTPASGRMITIWGDADLSVTTATDGTYEVFLPPGDYKLILDPSDQTDQTKYGVDDINDGDQFDDLKGLSINCTIEIDEIDDGNNFFILPPSQPEVSGTVMIDTDGDGLGDELFTDGRVVFNFSGNNGQSNVPIGPDGSFSHQSLISNRLLDGYLTLEATGHASVSDYDDSPDPDGDDSADGPNNSIPVRMSFNEIDEDNNFVVRASQLGSISGTVFEDYNRDEIRDAVVSGVTIRLYHIEAGMTIGDRISDINGKYQFDNIVPGQYFMTTQGYEGNPIVGLATVFSGDESPEDGDDHFTENSFNSINVTVLNGEDDEDNNYVIRRSAPICGRVTLDTNNDDIGDTPQVGAVVSWLDSDGNFIGSVFTDDSGSYFIDADHGSYRVVVDDPANSISVSDEDTQDDGDPLDMDSTVDNMIDVILLLGEDDRGNDFVDRLN